MLLDIIAGARPNFMKVAPVPCALEGAQVPHADALEVDRAGIEQPKKTPSSSRPWGTERNSSGTARPRYKPMVVGARPATRLKPALDRLFAGEWKVGGIPPLWDGHAGERIVAHLEGLLA